MRLNAKQIAEYATASVIVPAMDPSELACGLTWDSRDVKQGDVYVALPGARVDGHDFVESALRQGASIVLVSHRPSESACLLAREMGAAILEVGDTYQAITDLAVAWRHYLRGTVIALTGSTGKTTTKNLVRDVLSTTFTTSATKGNQNNELGVPKTLLDANPETRFVVVEMGMRGAGQLRGLCEFVKPDLALITNCGECHIELLGSRENIARAKSEVVEALPQGRGKAVLNFADGMLPVVLEASKAAERGITIVGFDGSGDAAEGALAFATDISLDEEGCPRFVLNLPDGAHPCAMTLRGAHNVHNACAAAALAWVCGVPSDAIVDGLQSSLPEVGRQEILHGRGDVTVVNDAYNANPDSMRAALTMFAAMKVEGRRFAVLGDMGELGDFAVACHEGVGTFLASLDLYRLICVGELARHIASAAIAAGFPESRVRCTLSRGEALNELETTLEPGDAVLCKASHSMELDRIAKGLLD